MMKPLLLISFVIVSCSISFPQTPEALRRILQAQDLRDAHGLAAVMVAAEPRARERAAIAAGSVQDTVLLGPLFTLLHDHDSEVRRAAAYALGQMTYVVDSTQRRRLSEALLQRLQDEPSGLVAVTIIEGLGKAGDVESLARLLSSPRTQQTGMVRNEVALSLGRYAYRGIESRQSVAIAAVVLGEPDQEGRSRAAYALTRVANAPLLREHAAAIIAASRSSDAHARMSIASALGKLLDQSAGIEELLSMSSTDIDWRVRVNAVRSLGAYDSTHAARTVPALLHAMEDPVEHVSLTAINTIGNVRVPDPALSDLTQSALLRRIENEGAVYTVRQHRAAAAALAKQLRENALPLVAAMNERGSITRQAYIDALGQIPSREAVMALLEYAVRGDPRVVRSALEAIRSVCKLSPQPLDVLGAVRQTFLRGLESNDMAIITTAAGALSEPPFADTSSIQHLMGALRRLRTPEDVEPMVAVIQSLASLKATAATTLLLTVMKDPDRVVAREAATALETITGRDYRQYLEPHTRPSYTNFDWELLDQIRAQPLISVVTSRGTMVIELLPDDAPFTCVNFVNLARKGFYDGLTFHRVVPNFVIQGGDPRGDGWGGPGYAVRSEFSYRVYHRGMVGMASAGKDTEGCQFFVTHSPQPHLDGRYTIFGQVMSGSEVVDLIQVGDTIDRVLWGGR
jgi:cyclophilin family peptidyl-prolyl cis-trans isomerase/HEAT repeat protein